MKKITLIGAGQIGGTLAHLIALKQLIKIKFVANKTHKNSIKQGFFEIILTFSAIKTMTNLLFHLNFFVNDSSLL